MLFRAPVGAQSYILMDVDSGRILTQHNAFQKMYPASTTKILTALVAIEKGDLNAMVRIGPDPPKTGESSINLLEGEKFTLADLVRAALIRSANDSCVAIAEGVAGNVPAFVKMMNETAKAAGATHSHFANPHGLHDPNHYTTAYDLAMIARRAMTHSFFNRVVATKEYSLHGNWKIGPQRLLVNRNRLLFRWDKCDGVKTGYTKQAGNCLIASATITDAKTGRPWRLLGVVMKSHNSSNDSYNLLQFHGFDLFHPVVMARADEMIVPAKVVGGASPVAATVEHDIQLPLRSYEQAHLSVRPQLSTVRAPVIKGQQVGTLEYWFKDSKIASVPLVAREAASASLIAEKLPAAAPFLPNQPWQRYAVYALVVAFLVTLLAVILTIFKVKSNARRKARKIVRYEPTRKDSDRR